MSGEREASMAKGLLVKDDPDLLDAVAVHAMNTKNTIEDNSVFGCWRDGR
jgi:hypothetical protein